MQARTPNLLVKATMNFSNNLAAVVRREEKTHPGSSGELSQLLTSLGLAMKVIGQLVATAGFKGLYGYTGTTNIHDERTQVLDDHADKVLVEVLSAAGHFGSLVSEERDEAVMTEAGQGAGKYVVAFDPLDGSSNIGSNIPVGTIFAIWERKNETAPPSAADFLQPGTALVAAGYALYGAKTSFVYTTGDGVRDFTLDPTIGEFILTEPRLTIPAGGKIVSVNEANYPYWSPTMRAYIHSLKEKPDGTATGYTCRYVGTLVADFDRTIRRGGIFLYPPSRKHPKGRLRLLYECLPLAFIAEQAGGLALDGKERLLTRTPQNIHERAGFVVGETEEVTRFLNEANPTVS